MAYPYMSDMMEMSVVAGVVQGLLTPAVLGVAAYVLTALTLYTMAQRRGIHHAWLAWVPVVNVWVLGSLADQYRYVARGQNRSKRKSLIVLSILSMAISVAVIILAVVMVVQVVFGLMGGVSESVLLRQITGPVLWVLGLSLPWLAIVIARAVVYYMALFDVYQSMDPANCTVFLVLSIIFGVTEPFFLFFNRNKDLGMPPRRETVHTAGPWDEQ